MGLAERGEGGRVGDGAPEALAADAADAAAPGELGDAGGDLPGSAWLAPFCCEVILTRMLRRSRLLDFEGLQVSHRCRLWCWCRMPHSLTRPPGHRVG